MKRKWRRLGPVGMVLIILAIGVAAAIGWHAMRRDNYKKQPAASEHTVKTTSYTDSSKLYTVSYPEAWIAKEAGNCCEGASKDYTKIPRGVTFAPPSKADTNGYGVSIQADKTDFLAKSIEQGWTDNKHMPEVKIINGYDAKYVKISFDGDAENYIDHDYLITHKGASIFLTFREKYYHQYPAENWSASQDIDTFNGIVNSIRFLE